MVLVAAVVQVQSQAQELSHATGTAKKKKKKSERSVFEKGNVLLLEVANFSSHPSHKEVPSYFLMQIFLNFQRSNEGLILKILHLQ